MQAVENSRPLFFKKQEISDFVEYVVSIAPIVYRETSASLRQEISSSSPYCFNVSRDMEMMVSPFFRGFSREYREITTDYEKLEHCYLKGKIYGKTWIIDPTYLQFVAERERSGLPDVMILSFKSTEELENSLAAHRVPEEYRPFWHQP